jgi:hypothetical protein
LIEFILALGNPAGMKKIMLMLVRKPLGNAGEILGEIIENAPTGQKIRGKYFCHSQFASQSGRTLKSAKNPPTQTQK